MDNDLKAYLDAKFATVDSQFATVDAQFATVKTDMVTLENNLVEKMRDMQTELLRGFEAFSAGQTIRLRKVEADQSNLNTALSGRVDILESRLTQIELRLGKQ
jgi:hypothetical protein